MITLPIMYVYLLSLFICKSSTSWPSRLVIDFVRRGAFTSWILIELIWLCKCRLLLLSWSNVMLTCSTTAIVWVLWIAAGALTVNNTGAIFTTCDFVADWANQFCRETQGIEAFSFLAWLTRTFLVPST